MCNIFSVYNRALVFTILIQFFQRDAPLKMENYKIFGRIGEGAHGVVFHGQEIKTGEKVALKKIPLKRLEDGLPIQVLREIKALQHCSESNEENGLKINIRENRLINRESKPRWTS
jgi:serine/threonine protein kinase